MPEPELAQWQRDFVAELDGLLSTLSDDELVQRYDQALRFLAQPLTAPEPRDPQERAGPDAARWSRRQRVKLVQAEIARRGFVIRWADGRYALAPTPPADSGTPSTAWPEAPDTGPASR